MFTENSFLISQILVGFVIILDILTFQFKKREHMLLALICSSALYSVHFFLLGVYTAATLIIVSIIRFILAYISTDKKILYFVLCLTTVAFYYSYQNYISWVTFAAMIFLAIGAFQKEDRRMRQIMMMGTSLFLVHNILVFTPMGIVGESIFLGSNLLGYYRFYLRKA